MADEGVYKKFVVYRADGESAPGRKHDGCSYFVLDLNHDKFAKPALIAYAEACNEEYPELASDLLLMVNKFEFTKANNFPKPQRKDGEAPCGECHLQPKPRKPSLLLQHRGWGTQVRVDLLHSRCQSKCRSSTACRSPSSTRIDCWKWVNNMCSA